MRSPVIPLELRRQARQFLRDHIAAIAAAVQLDEAKLLARGLPSRCYCDRVTLKLVGGETMSCPRALVVHDRDLTFVLTAGGGYFVFYVTTIAALEVEPATGGHPPADAAPPPRKPAKRRKSRTPREYGGNVVSLVRPRKGG